MEKKCFKCKGLTTNSLTFSYKTSWDQDELLYVKKEFLTQYALLDEIEYISGADLEVIRLKWAGHDYNLYFECYGQSIWIECPESDASVLINKLYNEIKSL